MIDEAGSGTPRRIVVDGDATVDWHLVTGLAPSVHGGPDGASVTHRLGGAALLAELVTAVAGRSDDNVDVACPPAEGATANGDAGLHQSWWLWSRAREGGGYRVERPLGITPPDAHHQRQPLRAPENGGVDQEVALVVLDDEGLGFRDTPDWWPDAVTTADTVNPPLIVLSASAPVGDGKLWEHLVAEHSERLVVVVRIEDLRASQVQISRGLSWERTAQDLVWELTHNPDVQSLGRCPHVVVSFAAAGAVVVSRVPGQDADFTLVFDPTVMEGEWEADHPGTVLGSAEALTAFIAHAVLDGSDHDRLCEAVVDGLVALRSLHESGYVLEAGGPLGIPFDRVIPTRANDEGTAVFARVRVRDPARLLAGESVGSVQTAQQGYWTILEDAYPNVLAEVSHEVVVRGATTVLRGVPHGRFGKLLTVDRHEIEALRAIRGLMYEYCTLEHPDRPLSLAVFGPPGSGKSFGVGQVATSLLPGRLEKLEFNLSQFESADELIDALHQVRDTSLAGKIPLVFWDEFDTTLDGAPLGWLRHFLAPMQDGAFRQGQLVHPIGRAIFVFAGGTSASMHGFGADLTPAQLRSAKKPDFVSRLRGYLDVLGPNAVAGTDGVGGDRFHELRRAILLDSLLRRKAPRLVSGGELVIDPGVLRAFLHIPTYLHGARSMEAIIDMSHLAGHRSFQRSSLPSESQLDLHVDGRRFLALVQRLDLSGDMLERLAMAAHEIFCSNLVDQGYRHGPVTDEEQKVSAKLCPYEDLAEVDKEQNRANVRDIPNKLAYAGYVMLAAKSEEVNAAFHRELIEDLARLEHERWTADKVARGWIYGIATDEQAKRHDALVPWEDLSEAQRDKDRAFVTGTSEVLRRCGYAVIPVVT